MKLKKLVPLMTEDFLITDLDENITYSVDNADAIENQAISEQLSKRIISISSFYDQVLVRLSYNAKRKTERR